MVYVFLHMCTLCTLSMPILKVRVQFFRDGMYNQDRFEPMTYNYSFTPSQREEAPAPAPPDSGR